MRKYNRVIICSILSWVLYYMMNYNEPTKEGINKITLIAEKYLRRGDFSSFMFFSLLNYFLLLFGIISIVFLIYKLKK